MWTPHALVGASLVSVAAALASGLCTGAAEPPQVLVTPQGMKPGSIIRLEVDPPTPGYELTEATRVAWLGRYEPKTGTPSKLFAVGYTADRVTLVDQWTVEVVLGDGSFSNAPNPLFLDTAFGSLVGTATLSTPIDRPADFDGNNQPDIIAFLTAFTSKDPDADLASPLRVWDALGLLASPALHAQGRPPSPIEIQGPTRIGLPADASSWHMIYYPTGPGGIDPPEIGPEPDAVNLYRLSILPNPLNPTAQQLWAATGAHNVIVIRLKKNSATASAPDQLSIDAVVLDAAGNVFDRADGLVVRKVASGDDPKHVVYTTDLARPIVLVDVELDAAAYPDFVLLAAPVDGTVAVVPSSRKPTGSSDACEISREEIGTHRPRSRTSAPCAAGSGLGAVSTATPATAEPTDGQLRRLAIGEPRLDSKSLTRLIRQLVTASDEGADVNWRLLLDVVESDAQHTTARWKLLEHTLLHGPAEARTEAVLRANLWTQSVADAGAERGSEPRRTWAELTVLVVRWAGDHPSDVPPDSRQSLADLLAAIIELRLFMSPDGDPLLSHAILRTGLGRERTSELAADFILATRRVSLLGSPLVDALLPKEVGRLKTAVRTASPDRFPIQAAEALADLGDPAAEPVLKDAAARLRRSADASEGDTARFLRMLADRLDELVNLLRLQSSTDTLLEWAVTSDAISGRMRAWAFERAHELGAPREQIRAALRALVDRVRREGHPVIPVDSRLRGEAGPVKDWAVRAGVLDASEFPEIPADLLEGRISIN